MKSQTINTTASGFAETAVHRPHNPILKIQIPAMLLDARMKAKVMAGVTSLSNPIGYLLRWWVNWSHDNQI
jgi:hypothetical protein